ncbi:uncharacterized protein ACNS7B_009678 [Menidia menidia]
MPHHTQQSLVYFLLLWTTFITIIQIVLIALFFAAGQNGWSLNSSTISSTVEPNHTMQSQHGSNNGLILGKGKMVTFKATSVKETSKIQWESPDEAAGVISDQGELLTIKKDGYYFLSLQVKLCPSEIDKSVKQEHTVELKVDNNVLLVGWINTKTNSTGLISKVHRLSAGKKLGVYIDPPCSCVDTIESMTYLDIIFMDNP